MNYLPGKYLAKGEKNYYVTCCSTQSLEFRIKSTPFKALLKGEKKHYVICCSTQTCDTWN